MFEIMDNVGSNFNIFKLWEYFLILFFKFKKILTGTRFAAIHPYEKLIAYESGLKHKLNFILSIIIFLIIKGNSIILWDLTLDKKMKMH